jgi:hypothetical protein
MSGLWDDAIDLAASPVVGDPVEFAAARDVFVLRRDEVQSIADSLRHLTEPETFDGHLNGFASERVLADMETFNAAVSELIRSADQAQAIYETHRGRLATLHESATRVVQDAHDAIGAQESLQAQLDAGTEPGDVDRLTVDLDLAHARIFRIREEHSELHHAESAFNQETVDELGAINLGRLDGFVDALGRGLVDGLLGGARGFVDGLRWFAALGAHIDGEPVAFAEWMRGQEPNSVDHDMAELAKDVYGGSYLDGDPSTPRTVNGWRPLSHEELASLGLNPDDFQDLSRESGLQAGLYEKNGGYVLAFAGTEPSDFGDWQTNLGQASGLETDQYDAALDLGKQIQERVGTDNLAMTGHSLGGGLASYAALGTGTPAVTFNAAGLRDVSLEQATGLTAEEARTQARYGAQIRAYRTNSDILTSLQEDGPFDADSPLADAVGNPITITDPADDPAWYWDALSLGGSDLGYHISGHTMDAVLAAMEHGDMSYSTLEGPDFTDLN